MYSINKEKLWEKYKLNSNKSKFNTGIDAKVLPFKTKKNENAFKNSIAIFSMMSRNISEESYSEILEKEKLIERIVGNVETEHQVEFKNFIDRVFFDESILTVFHPKVFNYINVDDNSVKEISNFMYNSLYTEELKEIGLKIYKHEATTIVEKLILESMPKTINMSINKKDSSFCIIDSIKDMFKEDFDYICKDPQFFIENVEMLIQYYLVFLCIQTSLKLKSSFDAEDNNLTPVYYFVDWEQVSKSRTAYSQGWKMVSSKVTDLFAYANLLEILNTTNTIEQYSFIDIRNQLNNLDQNELEKFKDIIYEFVEKNSELLGIGKDSFKSRFSITFNGNDCVEKLLSMLILARNTGKKTAYSKYEDTLKDVVKHKFLKPRGSLGLTLNIKEEWLIFLTRLCIKANGKIRLNVLWEEMEKRGIYFDKYTRGKIVEYYEKINLLEKKSDSGDAQYVRIL